VEISVILRLCVRVMRAPVPCLRYSHQRAGSARVTFSRYGASSAFPRRRVNHILLASAVQYRAVQSAVYLVSDPHSFHQLAPALNYLVS